MRDARCVMREAVANGPAKCLTHHAPRVKATPSSLHGVRRPEVLRQKPVNLLARVLRQFCVEAVEGMGARSVGVNFVLETLAGGLVRFDEVLDFEYVDILVVGRGVDAERSLAL